MTANVYKRMVYSYLQPMWHAITEPSLAPMKAMEILKERFCAGGETPTIYLRPTTFEMNGELVTEDYKIIRGASAFDPLEYKIGTCTDRFHPMQPAEICQSFDDNVGQPAETMAFLGHGEDMFISWKMPEFEVVVGDVLQLFGIVRCGFDTLNGARLFTSTYRPVCQNTISMAQNWADHNTDGQGKGNVWKGKGVNKNLLRDLGYWMKHVQESALHEGELLKGFFGMLAKTSIKSDVEAKEIIYDAFPNNLNGAGYYPKELRPKKEEEIAEFNETQTGVREGIYNLFAGAGTAITPDYWGMLNSTSEYFCHVQPSKRPIAESVMFGPRQKQTMRMVNVLSERVA